MFKGDHQNKVLPMFAFISIVPLTYTVFTSKLQVKYRTQQKKSRVNLTLLGGYMTPNSRVLSVKLTLKQC